MKATVDGAGRISLTKNGKRFLSFATKEAAGKLITKIVGVGTVLFVINAAANAKADGGSNGDALEAALREMVDADMWEQGFQLTVVKGCDIVGDKFIPPILERPGVKRILDNLSPADRAHEINRLIRTDRTFQEFAQESERKYGVGAMFRNAWEEFWTFGGRLKD